MEEILYTIEIYRKDIDYIGKLFSSNNNIKEFNSKKLDDLLRDIVEDIQLDHDISCDRAKEFFEDEETI